jgi:signal transduction histidine kinase/CheY-like chemotaxis protein
LKKGAILIGGGELDYRIPVTSRDELGEVAKAFNTMSAKLQNAMTEVRRAKDNADMANKAKSSFLANMSHELRTPLNAIIGYSEMMLEDLELGDIDQEAQHRDLDKVLTAGRHLLTQINDVLDFSKIETGKMTVYNEEFDSQSILQEVLATITPLARKSNNELSFVGNAELPGLINDVTKFRQIFFNLLSNSCKFTHDGLITLRAEYDRDSVPAVARFTVVDNGIGMNQEHLDRVFEAFVQADTSTTRRYGGTGLGLALCKQYCQLMGGDIRVSSRENQGTTFTVEFPIMPLDKLSPRKTIEPVVTPIDEEHAIKILVIDDDPVALALTERYLHRKEYKFLMTDSGKEGIQLAEQEQPDIILLDLMMPVIDGWTVLSVLKEKPNTQHIPVILLTMLDEEELGIDMGAVDYLRKPIDWQRLNKLIQQLSPHPDRGQLLLVDDKSSQRDVLVNALHKDYWDVLVHDSFNTVIPAIQEQRPIALIVAAAIFRHHEKSFFYDWLHDINALPVPPFPILVIENTLDTEDRESLLDEENVTWLQREGFNVEDIVTAIDQNIAATPNHRDG